MGTRLLILFVVATTVWLVPAPASAATIAVTTTEDELNADGDCSLREAIQATNTNADVDACDHDGGTGPDFITLGPQTYSLVGADGEDANASGDLDIEPGLMAGLTIDGASAGTTIIDAGDNDRVMHVEPGTGPLTLTDLTVSAGDVVGEGGGILITFSTSLTVANVVVTGSDASGSGGGIAAVSSSTSITLTDSTIGPNNTAGGPFGGGGIYMVNGSLSLTRTTVTLNQATNPAGSANGGGIRVGGNPGATIVDSVISDNDVAGGRGGGIEVTSGALALTNTLVTGNDTEGNNGGGIAYFPNLAATMTVTGGEIAGNQARAGGGGIIVGPDGSMALNGTTITGNSVSTSVSEAVGGGGVQVNGSAAITDSAVSDNTASTTASGPVLGGGIYNHTGGSLTITGSTISGNSMTGGDQAGAGLYDLGGTTAVTQSTISGNVASASGSDGGGVATGTGNVTLVHVTMHGNSSGDLGDALVNQSGSIGVRRTIVDDGPTACVGATDQGGNVDAGSSCGLPPGDSNLDPLLRPLADNGGPTQTHALGVGSPAADRIATPDCSLPTDQRGFPRPYGAGCDAGAYELYPCMGSGATVLGTEGPEAITGSNGPDVILAFEGDDTIDGGAGNDTLCGGDGDDVLDGSEGDDGLDGGAGTDTATFAGGPSVAASTAGASGQGIDVLSGVENLVGTDGKDRLTGDAGRNVLTGGSSNDRLSGKAGKDRLVGGKGRDRCNGGRGRDKGPGCELRRKIP